MEVDKVQFDFVDFNNVEFDFVPALTSTACFILATAPLNRYTCYGVIEVVAIIIIIIIITVAARIAATVTETYTHNHLMTTRPDRRYNRLRQPVAADGCMTTALCTVYSMCLSPPFPRRMGRQSRLSSSLALDVHVNRSQGVQPWAK